jgi:hypothetical protein
MTAGRERSGSTDCPTGAGYHRRLIASTGRRGLARRAALQVGITGRAAATRTREAKSRTQAAEADRARRRPADTLLAGPVPAGPVRAGPGRAGPGRAGPGRADMAPAVLDRADMAPAGPGRADMVRAVPDRADMARARPGPATRGQDLGRRIWVRRTAGLERPGHPAGRGH